MKTKEDDSIKAFLIEVSLYAVLVVGYFFLVLNFLHGWLKELFDNHKIYYAFVALGLIAGQGVLLEELTTVLLKLVRRKVS